MEDIAKINVKLEIIQAYDREYPDTTKHVAAVDGNKICKIISNPKNPHTHIIILNNQPFTKRRYKTVIIDSNINGSIGFT